MIYRLGKTFAAHRGAASYRASDLVSALAPPGRAGPICLLSVGKPEVLCSPVSISVDDPVPTLRTTVDIL
jgi:hypothetical protein